MERSCSAGALKSTAEDNPFLPQLHRVVQKPQRCRTTQSPSSSPKMPRLPPINAERELLRKQARNESFSPAPRSGGRDVASVSAVKRYNYSRESSLEKPGEKLTHHVVSSTHLTPPGSPTLASHKNPRGEAATSSTSYFSKPRFGRRTAAQSRSNLYRTRNTNEVLHSEILAMEEKSPHIFAVLDVPSKATSGFKDLGGKRIESSSVYKEDITCMLPRDTEDPIRQANFRDHNKTRAMKKFLDALDQHYYNKYMSAFPERRMAICEEIERTIINGNISLTGYREYLKVQDILDNWVL